MSEAVSSEGYGEHEAAMVAYRAAGETRAMALGNRVDLIHIGHLAVQAHRHDRLGARGDSRFQLGDIDVRGLRIDIDEYR